jgi:hypothetical protein
MPSDAVYYETRGLPGVSQVMRRARMRMFDDFMRLAAPRPGETILDIGVSDVITDEANYFARHYPRRQDVTCAGLADGASVLAAYPGVSYRRIEAGAPLPFADGAFAIATCNAVLEHVGGETAQRAFVAEMLRVATRVFVAIPNRWFPVEHHTAIPLLHYRPGAFRGLCRAIGRGYWADPGNLDFIGPAQLAGLFPADTRPQVRYSGLALGRFSSNLICLAARD